MVLSVDDAERIPSQTRARAHALGSKDTDSAAEASVSDAAASLPPDSPGGHKQIIGFI